MYEDIISKAYENIETGILYRIHKNNDIEPHITGKYYKKSFKGGYTTTLSSKGNVFITKISICPCGKRRIGKQLRSALCSDCMKIVKYARDKKAYDGKKSKPKQKTAKEIAYEITGNYPRVEKEIDVEKLIDDLGEKFEEIEFNRYLQTCREAA